MMWRYQTVFKKTDEETFKFSLCEVYLDDDGKLEYWTENAEMTPCGETYDELLGDTKYMFEDAKKWLPVEFDKMEVGMTFEQVMTER